VRGSTSQRRQHLIHLLAAANAREGDAGNSFIKHVAKVSQSSVGCCILVLLAGSRCA
jgi:hypothetical protein